MAYATVDVSLDDDNQTKKDIENLIATVKKVSGSKITGYVSNAGDQMHCVIEYFALPLSDSAF
jgi:hypothetical protein